jgi:deoxyribodipyrimidine photo-lyase
MILMWFRRDLRVADNLALLAACQHANRAGLPLIAAYIATPRQWQQHHMSAIQADFIHRRLRVLEQQLHELGIPLLYSETNNYRDAVAVMADWQQQYGFTELYYNKQYEINELQRDQLLSERCQQLRIHSFDDALLVAPDDVRNQQGQVYKVFTPFRRCWLSVLSKKGSKPVAYPPAINNRFDAARTAIKAFGYDSADSRFWPVDEDSIHQRLNHFCDSSVADYSHNRDLPAVDGTSQLSPYLSTGMLSPRQCLASLQSRHPHALEVGDDGAFSWLNELAWREFYIHLLVAYPELAKGQAFQRWTDGIPWRQNRQHFQRWQNGQTGYPIVDAAMRQLNNLGWMHNRLRMITASFLCKDLLINWRWGEQYFMSKLIDGDFAANNGGWQWCASTGTDAQPYFRIFNPSSQGKRFDPKGEFIRRYLPELAEVPDKYIHEIVDHAEARTICLQLYADCKADNNPMESVYGNRHQAVC